MESGMDTRGLTHYMVLKPAHRLVTILANSAKIAPPTAGGLARCYATRAIPASE